MPLHTTRLEVEKIMGRPALTNNKYSSSFRTQEELIFVRYSGGDCRDKNNGGWNVPADTVISISIEPDKKPKLNEIKLNIGNYDIAKDPELVYLTYYTSEIEGISITVNTDTNEITAFSYFPTIKDRGYKCQTTPK